MSTSITLPFNVISAISLFAARDDVRYYLNGVLIEVCENGTDAYVVGTNGHILAVHAVTLSEPAEPAKRIIGNEAIKQIEGLVKAHYSFKARAEAPVTITYSVTGSDLQATVEVAGSALTIRLVDGKYPDWRKVLPDNYAANGEAAQFDSGYLNLFAKAAKILGHTNQWLGYHLHHNGIDTAVVEIPADSEFLGLIMPVQAERDYRGANILLANFRN